MTDSEILSLLHDGLCSVAPDRKADFSNLAMAKTIEELGLDSIAAMELVSFVEDHIEATFPDEDLADMHTLGDLASLMRKAKDA
jgi:acyl carrier protein